MKSIFTACLFLVLACNNPVKNNAAAPVNLNTTDTIAEKSFIELGGEKQYVEITGRSQTNPVLLFLHGGPGWPQTPHLRYFNNALTKTMTVVAWEQSGCGQSYLQNPNPKQLSLDQIVKDAHELTQLLKKKFHQHKIYLAGFSWGSIPGLMLVQQYPEDYSAYFGITQVLNINQSILASREWIRMQASAQKDDSTLQILKRLDKADTGICKTKMDCFLTQYGLLNKYGGALFNKKGADEIEKAETYYEDYKKYDWFKAFLYSAHRLENDLFSADLNNIKELQLPVYFIMGRHDWNLPTSITTNYFQQLKAPKKEIIWFEKSGHEPLSEESEKFNAVLQERIK